MVIGTDIIHPQTLADSILKKRIEELSRNEMKNIIEHLTHELT